MTWCSNSAQIPAKGLLVTIDGPSGVGKTAVSTLLFDQLSAGGLPVVLTTEPSQSPIGELARRGTYEYQGLTLTCLVAADRYHHQDRIIRPALDRGQLVICDRYVPSSFVLDQIDGVDTGFLWTLYQYMRWPDLSIFLAADPALCRARTETRGTYSRFHDGGLAAGQAEARLFDETAAQLAKRGYPIYTYNVGHQDAEQVAAALVLRIESLMQSTF